MKFFVIIILVLAFGLPAASENVNQAAVIALVRDQRYDDARALLKQFQPSASDQQLLEAEIAYEQGQYRKAIAIYKALIAENPNLIILRERLIQIQLQDNAWQSARGELSDLAKINPNPVAQSGYLQLMNMLENVEVKSISYNLEMTPSANINNASETSNIALTDLPAELQPQFGWRASFGANALYARRIADRQSVSLRLYGGVDLYTVETLDQRFLQLNTTWNYKDARHNLELDIYRGRVWGDGETYGIHYSFDEGINAKAVTLKAYEDANYWGAGVAYAYSVSQKQRLNLNASWSQKQYDQRKEMGYADQQRQMVKVSYDYASARGQILTPYIKYTLYQERGPAYDYRSQNGFVGWEFGLNTTFQIADWDVSVLAARERRNYDLPHNFVFGAYSREEVTQRATVELSKKSWRIGPLAPKLECSLSRNIANIVDFERESFGCGLTLRKNF